MNEIKELFGAWSMIPNTTGEVEFCYSRMEITEIYPTRIETKGYYFTSRNHSTRYFDESNLDKEYKITDELTVFYSDEKSKCVEWLKKKRDGLLIYHKDLYERIQRSEIRDETEGTTDA